MITVTQLITGLDLKYYVCVYEFTISIDELWTPIHQYKTHNDEATLNCNMFVFTVSVGVGAGK